MIKLPEKFELPEVVNEALKPAATEIGKTLQDIFHLVFGKLQLTADKMRVKHEKALNDFRDDIQNNMNKIPEENLKEPDISILGPVMDASKFYIQDENLRKMFAKLLTSSLDNRIENDVHPCFVEILKNLSHDDAKLFSSIFKDKKFNYRNLVKLYPEEDSDNNDNYKIIGRSIANLLRLGLVEVDSNSDLLKNNKYKSFWNDLSSFTVSSYFQPGFIFKIDTLIFDKFEFRYFEVLMKDLKLTSFGFEFGKLCLDEE